MRKEPGVEIYINQKTVSVEELVQMYLEIQADLDNANSCLSQHEKEKHDMECQIDELKTYISELESELRVKEDLFKIKGAISDDSRPSIEWYEDRYQSDCITINQLHTTIDVLTDKITNLRKNMGLC